MTEPRLWAIVSDKQHDARSARHRSDAPSYRCPAADKPQEGRTRMGKSKDVRGAVGAGVLSGPTPQPVPGPLTSISSSAEERRRWHILGVIAIAQLMVVLDVTVMNIALPSAQRALDFTTVDRQWVVTAYTLAFGSLLLLGGRLADLLGRKVTFLAGLAGFAGVSAIGGASVNFTMLITARACQGAFAALLVPSALSLLTTTFTGPKDRGRAFGIYGAIAGAGGAVGLLLGGARPEYLSWRWPLYVNPIFAGGAFTGAAASGVVGVGGGWGVPGGGGGGHCHGQSVHGGADAQIRPQAADRVRDAGRRGRDGLAGPAGPAHRLHHRRARPPHPGRNRPGPG